MTATETDKPTKNQHYIPQFYLKNFTNDSELIHVFDVKNNRIGKPKSCSGVGYKPYYYAAKTGVPDDVSQQIEKWLQVFENIIAHDLPKIIQSILDFKQINNNDRYTLSALMSMLWLRSPVMRNQLNKMGEDMTKKMMKFYTKERVNNYSKETGVEFSSEERKKIIETFENGSYDVEFNNAHHLKFMTDCFGFGSPGFTNLFYGHKWKIYIAKGSKRFITTDSPIVEWWLPPQTFYGPSFLERKKYFALTPEMLFELTYPVGSDKIKRKTIFADQDETVEIFNILLAAHAHEFAYSHDKTLLEKIMIGRNNPGVLENKYYNHFELPWDKARAKGNV